MAQTKTRAKPKTKTKSKARSSSNAKKPNAKSKPKAAPRSNSQSRSNSKSSSTSKPKAAVESVEGTIKDAGKSVGNAASGAANKAGHAVGKAKVPLMAGGAALAGVAGGLALSNRQAHRHRSIKGSLKKVDSDDLAKAARKVGDFGAQIGELALEARRIRAESNGKRNRSPIEVVLDGLTARRGGGRG
jgi:hypothetical protein